MMSHIGVVSEAAAEELIAKWVPIQGLAEVAGRGHGFGAQVRADWDAYRVVLKVERSTRVKSGLFVHFNLERDIRAGAKEVCAVLQSDWGRALARNAEICAQIIARPQ